MCRRSLKARKGKKINSPLEPPEENKTTTKTKTKTQPCQNLDFNPLRTVSDFSLQIFKIINVCC